MSRRQKLIMIVCVSAACAFAPAPAAFAMHIMEGYLVPGYCVAWGAAALPFLVWGMFSIQKRLRENRRNITLLAMSGAFIFVISSLKIPSVTGSCSHMTGTGLGAILFGPAPAAVLGFIVLLFQAVLLAHGGLTTLGANAFSMAITGPVLSFAVYRLLGGGRNGGSDRYRRGRVFLAAFLGDLATYCVTSFQLALAYPSAQGGVGVSALKFLGVFAPTQLPLAVIEGILTVIIMIALETYARSEMKLIGFGREAG